MHIIKEQNDIYAFKTLEEADDFSKYLLTHQIFYKNIGISFNKYKCLSYEANFYLIELKEDNSWTFKCISSSKSAIELFLGEKRIIPLKLDVDFFNEENENEDEEVNENEEEEELNKIHEMVNKTNEMVNEMVNKTNNLIITTTNSTQKLIIYSTSLILIINVLKLFF